MIIHLISLPHLKIYAVTALLTAIMFPSISSVHAADSNWKLRRPFWVCIVDHIDKYQNVDENILIIVEELCPDPDQDKAANRGVKNNGLPEDERSNRLSNYDSEIIFSKKDLSCLKSFYTKVHTTGDIIEIPKSPCE